jgi:hypothetical protein
MGGHLTTSISYVMTRALHSPSSSPRLPGSSEVSLKRVGIIRVNGRKMRKHSSFQWTENRFTGSLMLRELSGVTPVPDPNLEDHH